MKSKPLIFLFVILVSILTSILVVVYRRALVDLLWGQVIVGYLALILSIMVIALILRMKVLRPYPLLRICLVIWPGVGTLVASGAFILATYTSTPYSSVVSIAAFVMVLLFIIQLALFPFAVHQAFKKRR
jgi:hypothetical protein